MYIRTRKPINFGIETIQTRDNETESLQCQISEFSCTWGKQEKQTTKEQ